MVRESEGLSIVTIEDPLAGLRVLGPTRQMYDSGHTFPKKVLARTSIGRRHEQSDHRLRRIE